MLANLTATTKTDWHLVCGWCYCFSPGKGGRGGGDTGTGSLFDFKAMYSNLYCWPWTDAFLKPLVSVEIFIALDWFDHVTVLKLYIFYSSEENVTDKWTLTFCSLKTFLFSICQLSYYVNTRYLFICLGLLRNRVDRNTVWKWLWYDETLCNIKPSTDLRLAVTSKLIRKWNFETWKLEVKIWTAEAGWRERHGEFLNEM